MDRIGEFQVFAAVAQTGSFSAAARSLRLSASAVSKLIARVENRTKVRLFDRSTKAAILTREGEAYLETIRRVLDAMADVDSVGDTLSRVPHGTLRIHAGPSFTRTQLAPILPEFMARYPDMRLEFRLGPKFVGLADDMDLAIQFGSLSDSSLILRKLAMSRRILCASPAYLERNGTPAAPADLAAHHLLNYTMPGRESWPFVKGQAVQKIDVRARISADQAELLLELAREGMGIARLPEYDTADDFAAGRLVPLLTSYCPPEAIYAVVRTRRNLSPRLRVFIDFIEQKLRSTAWNLDRR
jgi:DNA-binding transcriptional LysR family regulator